MGVRVIDASGLDASPLYSAISMAHPVPCFPADGEGTSVSPQPVPRSALGRRARRRTGCSFASTPCRRRLSRQSTKRPRQRLRPPRPRCGSLVSHIGHDLALSLRAMRRRVFSCGFSCHLFQPSRNSSTACRLRQRSCVRPMMTWLGRWRR